MEQCPQNGELQTTVKPDAVSPENSDNPAEDVESRNLNSNGEKPELSPLQAFLRVWSFAAPLDTALRTLAAIAAAGSGTAEPIMAIVFGNMVNVFNGQQPSHEFRSKISSNALLLVYLAIGKFTLLYFSAVIFNVTASRMASRIRIRYLRKALHQPIAYFDKVSPGSIAASLANDTNTIQIALSEKNCTIFQSMSLLLVSFIIAFTKAWKLTLVTATVLPYMVISTGLFGSWCAQAETRANDIFNLASGVAEEALSSILNITAMEAGFRIVQRYNSYIKDATHFFRWVGPFQALIYGNIFLATNSIYALAVFYGVKLVSRGEVADGGTVVSVLLLIVIAGSSMGLIAPLIPDFTRAFASSHQVVKMIERSNNDKKTSNSSPSLVFDRLRGEIAFRGIGFAYPERPFVTVLEDVGFCVPPNTTTAIVGHSGSGKSTIVGLLERWYSASGGSILIDNKDIKDLDLSWWRAQIGLVQQEPMLFDDSIYQNVLNGLHRPDYDKLDEEEKRKLVVEACKKANAHEFIQQLPQGYDTPIGERAGLLSGGQKQRIAIARSIVSNPRILLLDEATSALDYESERIVTTALERASQGRTTIIIAHKLSTVAKSDNIIVLNKGKIVEQGSHEGLVAKNGYYCRLLLAQGSSSEEPEQESLAEQIAMHQLSREDPKFQNIDNSTKSTKEVTSTLQSQDVGRRHSILWCMGKMYSEHPSLIWPTALAFLASLVGAASFPLQAVFFSYFIGIFTNRGQKLVDEANFWALMFFVLGLAVLAGYLVLMTCMNFVGSKMGIAYRHSYFKSMLDQDIHFFQEAGNTSGGLSALLASDGADVVTMFTMNAGLIAGCCFTLTICCVIAIAVYWKLGLVAVFACLPVILTTGFLRVRLDLTAQDRAAAEFIECARYSTESMAAIRTVSSLTMEERVEQLYSRKLQAASSSSSRTVLLNMLLYALPDPLVLAASALLFWYGGRMASYGEISTTEFFLITEAVIFGASAAGPMFGFTGSINRAHAALNRVLYLAHSKPPINSSSGSEPPPLSKIPGFPAIEFQDVRFHYPSRPGIEVLRGLSFSVPRGSHVCIVGPSGSGKSTVLALLERFYDLPNQSKTAASTSAGQILIHNLPISDWDIHKLRQRLGLVAQDTTLYHGTIRDNILLGLPQQHDLDNDSSESNNEDAAALQPLIEGATTHTQLHSFITSLPQSYNTPLSTHGLSLSGGQRQRLALARCLVRPNTDILLLDEATSALDPESERGVREALAQIRNEHPELTIVSVTHRVEGMKEADIIFVIEKGRVVESGHWRDLMKTKSRLWKMVIRGEITNEEEEEEEMQI